MKTLITEHFEFNYSESLQKLVEKITNCTNYNYILDFLKLKSFRVVKVNLFDNQKNFIDFIKSLNSPDLFIPDYCQGTFDRGMINHSITALNDENELQRACCSVFHELVHIINSELFYDKRVVWFDEGLAQNLSLEKSGLQGSRLLDYINNNINKRIIPKINDLQHGNSFLNKNINGYAISYISVRYLIESMNRDDFLDLLKHSDMQIKAGENNIIENAIKFFEKNN